MSQRFFNPAPQFFYSGTPATPLSGGLMYFYVAGTDTPKDTYSDGTLTTPNTNPVVLSSSGVLPNVFLSGSYKVILQDKNGVQQPGWPRDNVNSLQNLAFADWDSTLTYGEGGANIVTASNGNYYVSIQADNLNHEPSISPLWWSLWPFPSLEKGSMYAGTGTGVVAITPSGNGETIISDSGEAAGVKFIAAVSVAATQTQMEAATSNTVAVTPLNANWHPGVAKCWISANGAGTAINASHNITSITDDGTGLLTVTIATDFSSANYAILASVNGAGNDIFVSVSAQAAGSFSLRCRSPGGGVLVDPTSYFAAGFGDQ